METNFLDRIHRGMSVCDRDGDKIGTVSEIYRSSGLGTTGMGGGVPGMGGVTGHLRIDTGFLGLGKDYYIPSDAIRNVTSDCVMLNVDKDELNTTGWDVKPSYIR